MRGGRSSDDRPRVDHLGTTPRLPDGDVSCWEEKKGANATEDDDVVGDLPAKDHHNAQGDFAVDAEAVMSELLSADIVECMRNYLAFC